MVLFIIAQNANRQCGNAFTPLFLQYIHKTSSTYSQHYIIVNTRQYYSIGANIAVYNTHTNGIVKYIHILYTTILMQAVIS